MGMLAKFGVSAGSKGFFDSSMSPANQVMDFVRDHPTLSKVAAIAFPPARGVIMAAEIGNSVKSVLGSADREQATEGWQKTEGSGLSLVDRFKSVANNVGEQVQRHRERV